LPAKLSMPVRKFSGGEGEREGRTSGRAGTRGVRVRKGMRSHTVVSRVRNHSDATGTPCITR